MTAYWDVPVFADQTEVRANRIDGRLVNKARKTVTLLEMSCPWVDNRDHKDEEKTMKYHRQKFRTRDTTRGYAR